MYSLDFFINAVRYALDKSNYNLFLKVKQYKVLEKSLVLERDTVAVLPTGYGKYSTYSPLYSTSSTQKVETYGKQVLF